MRLRDDPGLPAPPPAGDAAAPRLAEVIAARGRGDDPAREAARRREEAGRGRAAAIRERAEWRLLLLCLAFVAAYVAVGGRMAQIAASEPGEPRRYERVAVAVRGEIVDRQGRMLAGNLPAWSLYAVPRAVQTPAETVRRLTGIFPDLDAPALVARLSTDGEFAPIVPSITPGERVAVHDIGHAGLEFGRQDARFYPNGRIAAHVLGAAKHGAPGAQASRIHGVAGVERAFDARLSDPVAAAEPLRLSIDLAVQAGLTEALEAGMAAFHAKAAAGVLMKARTGEIVAMVSLPDYDPNTPPDDDDPRRLNRAAFGVYELGSTFKPFTAAQAMEMGLAGPQTMIETRSPLIAPGVPAVRDAHRMPDRMTLADVIRKSSNVGTARLALMAGAERQKAFLQSLGLLDPLPLELPGARAHAPLFPSRWTGVSVSRISYGHGISVSPVHLAAGYAALVNGGLRVRPTLLADPEPPRDPEDRAISIETSNQIRRMLRSVVTDGTARRAEAEGFFVGGKTGTADKPIPGGYDREKVIATFASAFPIDDPEYVLVVMLDEATDMSSGEARRSSGLTAAPTARAAILRMAPALGLRPRTPLAGARAAPRWAAPLRDRPPSPIDAAAGLQ